MRDSGIILPVPADGYVNFKVQGSLPAMPDYEYHCRDCGATFTVHLTISEHEKNPPPECQKCGSKNVEQLLSGAMVITSKKS
jgi:putative FmdB family regulatory protein